MPQKIVEVPGMGNVEFPDSMSDDAISTILQGYTKQNDRTAITDNPPGMPTPPNAILQGPEAKAIDQARQAAINARGTYGPGVPAGYYEQGGGPAVPGRGQTGPYQSQLTPREALTQSAKAVGLGGTYAAQALLSPPSVLGRLALMGGTSGAQAALEGGGAKDIAIGAGAGLATQGAGEGLIALARRVPAAAKFIPRLLNASGNVAPETFENLQAAEPALRQAGAPRDLTQAGFAQHARNVSTDINNQIAPVIQQAASKDVTASTAKIAADLRAQITPEMQRVNPGVAKTLDKMASSIEETKDLGSLDRVRKEIEQRKQAINPTGVAKPYLAHTLNNVLDAIAEHVQAVRPDLQVRALRTQQRGLMNLADTFEESAGKGAAQQASQVGMTLRQKLGQKLPQTIETIINPKMAAARRLMQPGTAESFLQQAYKGARPAIPAPLPSPAVEESAVDLATRRPPMRTGEAEQIRSALLQNQNVPRGTGMNTSGLDPQTATNEEIMNWIRTNKPELFTGPAPEMNPARAGTTTQLPAESGTLQPPLESKFEAFRKNVGVRQQQEQVGQNILENMAAAGESPKELSQRFWKDTYPNLKPEAQAHFQQYIQKMTGFKPGDTIGQTADGRPIVAKDWGHIAEHILDLGHDPATLQGGERGLVALMKMAERFRGPSSQGIQVSEPGLWQGTSAGTEMGGPGAAVHQDAMAQAKAELGPNASIGQILQRAAKIQRGGP